MKKKKCSKCGIKKPLSKFNVNKVEKDGLRYSCKECDKKSKKKYYRTKGGVIATIYGSQFSSSKHRHHPKPNYTLSEFKNWILDKPLFHVLYDNWLDANCNKNLKPSTDRIKDDKPYTLDNLKVKTWQENNEKGHLDRINGVGTQGRLCKPVIGVHIETGERVQFHSATEAARQVAGCHQNIIACCLNKYGRKSSKGYIWKFNMKIP